VLWAPQLRDREEDGKPHGPRVNDSGSPLTKNQKVFNYLKNTVLHEIGHTLGLRHNFKGSTVPITSSIMDYLGTEDDYYNTGVGEYDRQAIKYLYHLSDALPTAAFCTDNSTSIDPECNRFDSGASPYDYFLDLYKTTSLEFVNLTSESPPNLRLNRVLQFVRAGKDSATRQMAWADAISFAKVLPAGTALPTGYDAVRVDKLAERVFRRLFLDEATLRGDITQDPADADVLSMVTAELRGNLLNTDGIRSWATRRTTVDVLKKLQSAGALSALKDAEADLQTKLPTLTGSDANDASDLLARIKTATAPYYTK